MTNLLLLLLKFPVRDKERPGMTGGGALRGDNPLLMTMARSPFCMLLSDSGGPVTKTSSGILL